MSSPVPRLGARRLVSGTLDQMTGTADLLDQVWAAAAITQGVYEQGRFTTLASAIDRQIVAVQPAATITGEATKLTTSQIAVKNRVRMSSAG